MSTVIVNRFANPKAQATTPPNERQGQASGPKDYGENNINLPQELIDALKGLLKHFGTEVDKFPRRKEVIDARRQRFYDAGHQYIYFNSSSYVFVPVTAGASVTIEGSAVQMPRYTNVYEIYKPYRRNFSAPLVQNPPGVNYKPADPSSGKDIKKAQNAEKYIEHVKQVNPQKTLQAKVARLYWTDGRVVAETFHEKNAQKWGRDEQGQERGEEITLIHGVLESKVVPITADTQEEVIAVIISNDPEINLMKGKYSEIPEKEKIKAGPSGTGETAFERNARLGVLQGMKSWAQTADAFGHLTVRHKVYLRPQAFEQAPNAVRGRLRELFSKGCFFTIVGEAYCGAKNISLDDALKISHALDGDGMARPSWGKLMVTVQDAYNNYKNMRQEYHDYGIPNTYYDTAFLDGEAMQEQISQPGNHIGGENPQPGNPLQNYFYTTSPLTPPADLVEAEQDLRDSYAQFATAVQPALFGAAVGGNNADQKVGVYGMAREQAMGVMALPWGSMQELFAGIYRNSVLAAVAERNKDQKLKIEVPGKRGKKSQTVEMTVADLAEGDFRAVPDTDSSFPETTSAKKSAFQEFMAAAEFNPLLMEATLQPDTIELGKELWGVDVDIPATRAQEKALEVISKLLQEKPGPDEQAYMQAVAMHAVANKGLLDGTQQEETPMPDQEQFLKASIDPDPLMDFHKYIWQACLNWWNSAEKDQEEEDGNQAGLLNVRLYAMAQKKFADAEQALQTMPPPTAAPGPAAAAPGPGPKKPSMLGAPKPAMPPVPASQPVM
jgi:hypothetical protein